MMWLSQKKTVQNCKALLHCCLGDSLVLNHWIKSDLYYNVIPCEHKTTPIDDRLSFWHSLKFNYRSSSDPRRMLSGLYCITDYKEKNRDIVLTLFWQRCSPSVCGPYPLQDIHNCSCPKKPVASCLNNYRPVALTSVITKCLERLLKTHICSSLPDTLESLQFAAYREEVKTLHSWCQDNNSSSFKFLSVHISEELSWTLHTDTVTKKAG